VLHRWKDVRHAGMTPERIAQLNQEVAAMLAALDAEAEAASDADPSRDV